MEGIKAPAGRLPASGQKSPGWLSPLGRRRLEHFRRLKRSWISLWLLLALIGLSFLAEVFINSRALAVWCDGQLYLPTYRGVILGREFGLDYDYETDYRQLKTDLEQSGRGWVILAPIPWNPYEQDVPPGTRPPYAPDLGRGHLLGTDNIGRDILARLVYGFRTAILFSLIVVGFSFFIGTVIGALMAYWGGIFDIIFQRIIEIWERVPALYVVMILTSIYKPDFLMFVLIYLVFNWTGETWTVRAMTYRERERDYILAAKTYGASTWRIIRVHIVPNILVVLVTALPFAISAGIAGLTALDYLGFGLPPPNPSWGELLAMGIAKYKQAPWILASILGASVAILTMISFVGEGLREAFDPKRHTVYR